MAKITINADTSTDEIECFIDGKPVDKVAYASIYISNKYDPESGNYIPCACVDISMKPVKENGVTYNMSAYAIHQDKAVAAINKQTAEFIADDIVMIKDLSPVSNDIANALRRK